MKTLGQVAWEAYANAFPGQARDIALARGWVSVPDEVKAAWDASAIAVGAAIRQEAADAKRA